jgi:hypothetical protein
VLRRWGIPVYLDAGPWVKLDGRPHRYCDVLNLLGLEGSMSLGIGGGPERARKQQRQFASLVDRLRPTGGEISVYAHECEFVTTEFWDAINFAGGADRPRELWQPAPLLSEEECEARYGALDGFLEFVQSIPDVEVVVASQAPLLYFDRAKGRSFSAQQVARLCEPMAERITHQACDGAWLSPGEILGLAIGLLAARVRTGAWPDRVPYRYCDGPASAPPAQAASGSLSLDDLYGTCLFEDARLDVDGQMPAQIQIGHVWLSPADFMASVGGALAGWLKGGAEDAPIRSGLFAQAEQIPEHVAWDWPIFPAGFDGDPLLQVARLQAWTLKPATRRDYLH